MVNIFPKLFPTFELYKQNMEGLLTGCREAALFGFGKIGREVFTELRRKGVKIAGIFDNNPSLHGQFHEGVPISAILPELSAARWSVIICSDFHFSEMLDQLEAVGRRDCLPYPVAYFGLPLERDEYYNKFMDMRYMSSVLEARKQKKRDALVIRNLDVAITECCSLRCRDCANLMQYFRAPTHSDFQQTAAATDAALDAVDYVNELHVLGGEPFLNQELPRYLDRMQDKSDRFDVILIFTNATIIPRKEALRQLKRSNVLVSITDYGNPRQKTTELTRLFDAEAVQYRLLSANEWQDCGRIFPRHRSAEENIDVFRQCCVKHTPAIKNGRLFRCPFAGNAAALGAVPNDVNESVDLSCPSFSREDLRTAIRTLLRRPFHKACDYCGGRPFGKADIPAAVQAPEPLPYTLYPSAEIGI